MNKWLQNSNVTQTIDGRNQTTSYAFDLDNRLTETIVPAAGSTFYTSWQVYDQNGNVTQAIDGRGKTTQYVYDPDNRLTKTTDPDGYSSFRAYDQGGNLTQTTDNKGNHVTYYYDDAGRVTYQGERIKLSPPSRRPSRMP